MSTGCYLVTGGAGFIGSNFVLNERARNGSRIVNLDKLTYAGNMLNLAPLASDDGYVFVRGDICDAKLIGYLLREYQPDAIVNFAAESHVDRSIAAPGDFVQTNVVGTYTLLEASRVYRESLTGERRSAFSFLHVSTDEVYGSLEPGEEPFMETHPYRPNSPYSASKAGSDHLVRAYAATYGLPAIITNCSNNYGPYQFPEKLIPHMILSALAGEPLPIYGDGRQVRDWLYVGDHVNALATVLEKGTPGRTYNIGGGCEKENLDVVRLICGLLDELVPESPHRPFEKLITHVADRPGHDRRYAIDYTTIRTELGWSPNETFDTGLRRTMQWYLKHEEWIAAVQNGEYRRWVSQNYDNR